MAPAREAHNRRMAFKDHFSKQAETYRAARPSYPSALFDWLAVQAPDTRLAWDAGCGNGQASVALARHFERVLATDPSEAQVANALPDPRVEYRVEPAERCDLPSGTASLVTVAQALHWFDLPAFYAEVRRVAKPGAVIAAWTYALCSITPDVDRVVWQLYEDIVGRYWPPERRHTMNGYVDLDFPFAKLADATPAFEMHERWDLERVSAYLRTWSAVQGYRADKDADPVALVAKALAEAWQDAGMEREVRWPLAVRVGRVK